MRTHDTNHRTASQRLTVGLLLLCGGCYTAELDPELTGLFACDEDDDEASTPCPSGQTCVNHRCENADALPSLTVLAPEDEESLVENVSDVLMGMPQGPAIDVILSFQGSLELSSPGEDHEFGEGHVVVYVDGDERLVIDSGDIGATMAVEVQVPPVAGAHRFVLQAVRNDGLPYDNPEATATRLFWLESPVTRRPFVAVKSPWPGTTFGPEDQTIEVELATLNFDLVDPSNTKVEGQGHAHIHYDEGFPMCLQNPACDGGYIGIIGQSRTTEVTLPPSGAQAAELTAVLRHIDHSAYGLPFDCDPTVPGPLDLCMPVFETIEILRVED
ncbi:hypothetical protein [Paraliomyxa miuraensis]|uniref:hypothetical protein n=1 Tax=Paraliomyxa miuraensis TaxID=376150 RepID=UPI00224C9BB2|nr:hypothetical protein [Paraliomyxa miuraensis]MCX4244833.1 hypothetical protein [Paraliomyxa miuraensis]